MNTSQQDLQYIAQIRENNQRALEALFSKYYSSLCHFAAFFVSTDAIAEEVVADVFVKIWNKRAELNIRYNVKAYLFKATKFHALTLLRKEKNVMDEFPEDLMEEGYNPVESMMYKELEEGIGTMVDLLPSKRKTIFQLSRFEGFTYPEIAEILSISIKTVENQMGKALKQMKNLLKSQEL